MTSTDTPGPGGVDDTALAELRAHEAWHGPNLIRGIERHHPETHPGIPLALFDAYAERLGYDVDRSHADVEAKLVDDTEWQSDAVYYRVGDHVSAYPASWHDQYEEGGLRGLVGEMRRQLGHDVSRDELLRALGSIAGVDRRTADAMLTDARRRERVVVRPRTNPEAFVYPAKLTE
ncbi:hypothetical protein SAMN04487948_102433 [Halogranum amylolyticum]|uniref:Uncharacterized protein n=1 Tax=Halogranum amylolyticum TaxID=660520 RepID=A0A1H8PQX0_9EURY|nr:hypothetical protein [Halogranum amylolyticum]SEO44098.1 hypothetical protein SAMN04487948_102433 [Halogranum amylolyticum]